MKTFKVGTRREMLRALASLVALLGIVLAFAWLVVSDIRETERQRGIISDVRHLLDVLELDAAKSTYSPSSVSVKGKALVWDITSSSRSGAHNILPAELRASSSDSLITVFMVIRTRRLNVGTYSISG